MTENVVKHLFIIVLSLDHKSLEKNYPNKNLFSE